jgi:transposase InsO family protein
MPVPEQKTGTLTNTLEKIKSEKVAQNCWPILAQFNWPLTTTYIRLAKGFAYLTAVVDWASRKVLAAKLAITLEACHAVDVLQEAFRRYGTPEIVNTDQGSPLTAKAFVDTVLENGCQLSIPTRGTSRRPGSLAG